MHIEVERLPTYGKYFHYRVKMVIELDYHTYKNMSEEEVKEHYRRRHEAG